VTVDNSQTRAYQPAGLSDLVPSGAPTVVFGSVAQPSVVRFCDECRVLVNELGKPTCQPRFATSMPGLKRTDYYGPAPGAGNGQWLSDGMVCTPIHLAEADSQRERGYTGIVVRSFEDGRRPSPAQAGIAELLVATATATRRVQRPAAMAVSSVCGGPTPPLDLDRNEAAASPAASLARVIRLVRS